MHHPGRKDDAAFPLLAGLCSPQQWGAGREPVSAEGEWCPPLGCRRFPRCLGPQKGAPGRPRLPQPLSSGGPGTRREKGARRVAEERGRGQIPGRAGLGAGTPHHRTRQAGVAGRLTSASRGSPAGGGRPCRRPFHSPASGCTQPPGAQSPSPARTPGLAHTRRPERAHPWAPSRQRIRPGPGAHALRSHPPRQPRDWPGAARGSFAGRRRLPTPPESPPSPGGKRLLTRAGFSVQERAALRNRGEGLSFDKLEKPLDRVWKGNFLKRDPKTPDLFIAPLGFSKVLLHTRISVYLCRNS